DRLETRDKMLPIWLQERLDDLRDLLSLSEVVVSEGPGGEGCRSGPAVRFRTGDGVDLVVDLEIKQGRIGHATAQAFVERRRACGRDRLLAAPAIGREVADRLRAAGCSFLDSTGNCFLRLGEGRLLVDRRAAPRAERQRIAPASSA